MTRLIPLLALFVSCLAACGPETEPQQESEDADLAQGREVYELPFADGNVFSCATCHALHEPADDGLRRAGHPIGNATRRSTYKNGAFEELRDAVNVCVTEWMRAEGLEEDDARWTALEAFLDAQAEVDEEDPLDFAIVAPPSVLIGGDAVAGMLAFNASCASCHGAGAAGAAEGPSLIGGGLDNETIARRVRTSGSTTSRAYGGLTGGQMPFWSEGRLSDSELLDVVAFVAQVSAEDVTPVTPPDPEDPPVDTGCVPDASHPMVGQTAVLQRFSHDVGGTARVVDSCTIEIENFSFDGGGINIQIYGGEGGDYDPPVGFSLSDNLLGQRFEGETFTINLGDGDIDQLDGISVWCVPVGISFGDGLFE